MYNAITFRTVLLLVIATLLLPVVLFAQEPAADDEVLPDITEAWLYEATEPSCFDYYTFGSIDVKLKSSVVSAVSGTPITFNGTIHNNNPYPIVDGSLYVKVFRMRNVDNDANGPDVVDEFFVQNNIVMPAQGSTPIAFSWNIPAYAQSGEYVIATFFTTSRKFNLLGLSFTDDVVGNKVFFTVMGDAKGGVQFDKAGVTVNRRPYMFASFPPRVGKNDPIVVRARIQNTTRVTESVTVRWSVYQWDAQLRENVVQEEQYDVIVPANSSAFTDITITNTEYPVYLAKATLTSKDTESIIGVRVVREGIDRIRINFPGVLSYPLVQGQVNTLFSCLHNSGESALVESGSLALTLSDMQGNVIHEYIYEGSVSGAMMGLADTFVPDASYDNFVLDARLYQHGVFVDEAHVVYDCKTIAPGTCARSTSAKQDNDVFASIQRIVGNRELALMGFGAVGVALLLIIGTVLMRSQRVTYDQDTSSTNTHS